MDSPHRVREKGSIYTRFLKRNQRLGSIGIGKKFRCDSGCAEYRVPSSRRMRGALVGRIGCGQSPGNQSPIRMGYLGILQFLLVKKTWFSLRLRIASTKRNVNEAAKNIQSVEVIRSGKNSNIAPPVN